MFESVAPLFPAPVRVGSSGSFVPTGVKILAAFTSGLGAFPATVPMTVNVRLLPDGSVGITMPAPCIAATVDTGQIAPPVSLPQVTLETESPVMLGSVKIAPSAGLGPALATTIV